VRKDEICAEFRTLTGKVSTAMSRWGIYASVSNAPLVMELPTAGVCGAMGYSTEENSGNFLAA
jgi:hypothetical protein